MNLNNPTSTRHRPALVGGIMFLVLLASTIGAYVLVKEKQALAGQGNAIIRRLSQDTLSKYWGTTPFQLFYLGYDKTGRVLVWRYVLVESAGDGYDGQDLTSGGGEPLRMHWQIQDDARAFEYDSETPKTSKDNARIATTTLLKDGVVLVHQAVAAPGKQERRAARGPAPANYIPEGTSELVAMLTLKEGRKAVFRTILDDQAIVGSGPANSRVNFSTVSMTPLGGGRVRAGSESILGGGTSQVYRFQDKPWPVEIETPDVTFKLVSRDEFLKHFPSTGAKLPG